MSAAAQSAAVQSAAVQSATVQTRPKLPDITLDPAVKAVVDAMGEGPYLDFDAMPNAQVMAMIRLPVAATTPPPNSKDLMLHGQDGAELRLRLYYPDSTIVAPLPILLHLHGGGFVGGSIEQDDARCVRLAGEARCIVASLDYRLAPEHRFPAAIEDAFSALRWIANTAKDIGGDASRCAISGSSAGGHIAVGATLLARARGSFMPLFQLLTYPVIDPSLATSSYRDFAHGPFMTRARMAWYWKQYAGGAGPNDDLWAPLSADAKGLPPAHVITAELDVLRDEGEAYAAHLRAAGIAATTERHAQMVHGFITVLPQHPASDAALKSSAAVLRRAFGN